MIQKMVISLSCIAIITKVVDAGVSSFHDLQTIISPSPLDVLDNLDDYDKFWIDVHQKSCGTLLFCMFSCVLQLNIDDVYYQLPMVLQDMTYYMC